MTRFHRIGGLMLASTCVFLLTQHTDSDPGWRTTGGFPTNPYPSSYSQPGLSTWDTDTSTTDSDWTVRYRINGINTNFTISTNGVPSALTSSKASETLTTYWLFTADEYSASGPARTGVSPSLATYTSQGYNNPVAAADFVTSVSVTDVGSGDNNMNFDVTCRGINSEDNGSSSDSTEAPDSGTYTTSLTLRITY